MAGRNCCKTTYAHEPSHAILGLGETPESCGRTFCDELEQKSGRPETFFLVEPISIRGYHIHGLGQQIQPRMQGWRSSDWFLGDRRKAAIVLA